MKRPALALCLFLLSAAMAFGQNSQWSQLDLVGTPDLTVDSKLLGSQWVVRDEQLDATLCSVEEGGVTPGLRRIVRFTVMTPNIGDADLYVGDPNEHVALNDGLFEFAECHHHYHFKHYALYQLIDPKTGYVWKAAKRGFCMLDTDPVPSANEKRGFCMLDTDPVPSANGNEPPRSAQFKSCGAIGVPGNQGISHGWADTYRFFLGGQYFVLDGGDGQPPVPPGEYIIRITVNPPYDPDKKGNCPRVKDPMGTCRQFAESDYTNNVGEVLINIPDHPGRSGVGPLNNTKPLGYEPPEH